MTFKRRIKVYIPINYRDKENGLVGRVEGPCFHNQGDAWREFQRRSNDMNYRAGDGHVVQDVLIKHGDQYYKTWDEKYKWPVEVN